MSDATFRIISVLPYGGAVERRFTYQCNYKLHYTTRNIYVLATDPLDAFQIARRRLLGMGYVEAEGEP